MTRRLEVRLTDDIDGTPADETVSFGLDGSLYEIDLTAKRAGKFRSDLAKYVNSARKTSGGSVARRGSSRNSAAQNQAIREWARRKKIPLSGRGRIPHTVVERYESER